MAAIARAATSDLQEEFPGRYFSMEMAESGLRESARNGLVCPDVFNSLSIEKTG
jgi:hypothetical protein